ncbi:MAG: DNA-binding protein [Deltaproteobacteria bacterium CG2_30_63_29]|nr:MAG: DNA-binding protein [Deltaproteobacteria bacterium CG2_30_63_29]
MHEQEPWVSVDEVAKHLGIAKDTVYRWIESKSLPAHRVGRLWKFKLSQVDAWIEAGGAAVDEVSGQDAEQGPYDD